MGRDTTGRDTTDRDITGQAIIHATITAGATTLRAIMRRVTNAKSITAEMLIRVGAMDDTAPTGPTTTRSSPTMARGRRVSRLIEREGNDDHGPDLKGRRVADNVAFAALSATQSSQWLLPEPAAQSRQ